jgi:hypothetical protein
MPVVDGNFFGDLSVPLTTEYSATLAFVVDIINVDYLVTTL